MDNYKFLVIDAVTEVREISAYVCSNKGGEGAVREFIEWLGFKQE